MSQLSVVNQDALRNASKLYTPEAVMLITCSTLAIYNTCELLILIFTTFQRRRGLYFWSLLVASAGAIPYHVGLLVAYFDFTYDWVGIGINNVGWILLITGQSIVLYSRLHLVLMHDGILRAVLRMIIINGVVWHTSITALFFGSNYSPVGMRPSFTTAFGVLEKVQMTCFCLQEFIISGLYIWKTVDILKTSTGDQKRLMRQLFAINLGIVIMDIGLLAVEYKSLFIWEQGLKGVIYTVKLKLEFAVLGELVDFVQQRGGAASSSSGFVEFPSNGLGKMRPDSRPKSMHLEDLNGTTPAPVLSKNEQVEMPVAARKKGESEDYRSTRQLYQDAMQEISR